MFHIQINDRILLGATYDAGDSVVARILADSGLTTIGGVQFPTNAVDTRTRGVDLTADLRLPAGNGTLDLNAAVNYTKNELTHVEGLPPILEGTATSFTGSLDLITTLAITEERPGLACDVHPHLVARPFPCAGPSLVLWLGTLSRVRGSGGGYLRPADAL